MSRSVRTQTLHQKAGHQDTGRRAAGSPLLIELRDAHDELLEAIGELEQLTSRSVPTKRHLVDIRWKVSRASLSRRLLWGRIEMSLSPRLDPHDREELRRLQDADIALLRSSTEHVTEWTVDAVLQDWGSYCRASKIMRSQMKRGIAAEKRTLYPILRRVDQLR